MRMRDMAEARTDTELSDAAARLARQAKLADRHAAPLVPFVETLRRQYPERAVPWFDPLDGGAGASVLFLLEKPSRRSAEPSAAPAFISRDNPTHGARTLARLMKEAGVPRTETLIWNAVPWWNGTPSVTAAERADGAQALSELLSLLPALRAVCLVGRKAELVWADGPGAAVPVFVSAHFSANVRAAFPERWLAIPSIWQEAYLASRLIS